ncbi:MAG: hypothetical protein IPN17_24320 [Deltaproteobacteria bacterium]|nr:hypothetical protein [Deltaproteobacteria bacterium]
MINAKRVNVNTSTTLWLRSRGEGCATTMPAARTALLATATPKNHGVGKRMTNGVASSIGGYCPRLPWRAWALIANSATCDSAMRLMIGPMRSATARAGPRLIAAHSSATAYPLALAPRRITAPCCQARSTAVVTGMCA